LLIGSEELLSRESEEIKEELLRSVLVPSCFFSWSFLEITLNPDMALEAPGRPCWIGGW